MRQPLLLSAWVLALVVGRGRSDSSSASADATVGPESGSQDPAAATDADGAASFDAADSLNSLVRRRQQVHRTDRLQWSRVRGNGEHRRSLWAPALNEPVVVRRRSESAIVAF